jgi:hypothetical protein
MDEDKAEKYLRSLNYAALDCQLQQAIAGITDKTKDPQFREEAALAALLFLNEQWKRKA